MKDYVTLILWFAAALNLHGAIRNWRQYKAHEKSIKLSREMDIEFKALSEAWINQDADKFKAHKERWHELRETWERDFKK